MSTNDAAIPFYFTPAAQAELVKARSISDSPFWHDKEIGYLIQMAVKHGWKYDVRESNDPGQPPR